MFRFENKSQKIASHAIFIGRLIWSLVIGLVFIGLSLAGGVAGYMHFASLGIVDAFLNASMILAGMGPIATLPTDDGKIFAALYALYSGLVLIAVSGILLAPVLHRVLHAIHADEQD
jgi:hypothetical protein